MGCKNSREVLTVEGNLTLVRDRDMYLMRHEKLEQLIGMGKSLQEIQRDILYNFDNIDIIVNNFNQDKTEIKSLLIELLAEAYIKDNLKVRNYDVLDYAHDLLQKQSFQNKDTLYTIITNFSRIYPRSQLGINLEFDENDIFENKFSLKPIFSNLKFNNSYQAECLNLTLNNFLISKSQYLKEICDVIEINTKLNTIVIHIYQNNMAVNDILRSVRKNGNVKVLILIGYNSIETIFDKELINLMRMDNLLGLGLINIKLSEFFFKNLPGTLFLLKNLKFFISENAPEIIKNIFKSDSLIAVLLSGKEEGINMHKEMQNGTKIKFLEVEDKFII
jgi:hypothetical protein